MYCFGLLYLDKTLNKLHYEKQNNNIASSLNVN